MRKQNLLNKKSVIELVGIAPIAYLLNQGIDESGREMNNGEIEFEQIATFGGGIRVIAYYYQAAQDAENDDLDWKPYGFEVKRI